MTCLIIEDEAPAQRILQRYVTDAPGLKLIATVNNALSGLEILETQAIDLLFLDINLPKLTGIDLLRTLRHPPQVILTTAYPEYALEGYELNIVDYLLKPFTFARFLQAIRKCSPNAISAPVSAAAPDHFFVKADKVIHRVALQDLIYCQAEGDFVRLVLRQGQLLSGHTLSHYEAILAPAGVIRTHRSYLLRLAALRKLEGNQAHTERGVVPVGRAYRAQLLTHLQ
ncbi:MAG: LytTR family DNA-binding domain-containing protein [Bacteroidota bacterium]